MDVIADIDLRIKSLKDELKRLQRIRKSKDVRLYLDYERGLNEKKEVKS